MKRALSLSLLTAFAVVSLIAQRLPVGTAGSNPAGGNSPGNGGPPTQASGPSTSPTSPDLGSSPSTAAPIFLSGKVVIDDGSPTPPNVAIQRICQNNPRTVAFTNGKGQFSFQWGDLSTSIIPDASESGIGNSRTGANTNSGLGSAARGALDPLAGCELRANIAGFHSDSVNLTGHRALDDSDIGTIVLHRLANVEGTSVSATSLNAPKDAQKAYEKGVQSLHKNKLDDAAKEYQKAVAIYPKYANAWLDLGRIQVQQKMTDAARESFQKAVDADPKLVEAWIELGDLASRDSNWTDASQYLDRALKLDPVDFPQAWFVDAIAEFNLRHLDVAENSARAALKSDPQHRNPRIDRLLSLIFLQKNEYPEAAEEMRIYMKFAPNAPDIDQVKTDLAKLDSMAKEPKP